MWDTDRVRDSAFAYLHREGLLAKKPSDMMEGFLKCWVWNHEWNPDTLGTAFFAPPTITARYAASTPKCSEPFGRIHFAGSERSPRGAQWMDGAVYMGQHKAPEVLAALYPDRYHKDKEWQAYKARVHEAESNAIALLKKAMPHRPVLYMFEMVARWAIGNIRNIWHQLVEFHEEQWIALPPPLPPGAKFEMFTQADGPAAELAQNDHIFSTNGSFRFGITEHGTVHLLHLRKDANPSNVWESPKPHDAKPAPYKLVLQPSGDLQLLSQGSDGVLWNSQSATPKGLYASFRVLIGDDRGLNVYGYYANGSRQIIWSAHTSDIHFARPRLRDEIVHKHVELQRFHAALKSDTPTGYRKPENEAEKRILEEMFKQQSHEKSYGKLMARSVHVDDEARRHHHLDPHMLKEGESFVEGHGLLSAHQTQVCAPEGRPGHPAQEARHTHHLVGLGGSAQVAPRHHRRERSCDADERGPAGALPRRQVRVAVAQAR